MVRLTACETRWTEILESFERHLHGLVAANQGAKEDIGLVHTVQQLISTSLMANGRGAAWNQLADRARPGYFKENNGKYIILQLEITANV
jgi:hypothetical protein